MEAEPDVNMLLTLVFFPLFPLVAKEAYAQVCERLFWLVGPGDACPTGCYAN